MAHIMMWSDRPEVFGAEQINHALICAVADRGYQATFVQSIARNHLIDEREALDIAHEWLEPDDIYDLSVVPRQLRDTTEPREILERTRSHRIQRQLSVRQSESQAGRERTGNSVRHHGALCRPELVGCLRAMVGRTGTGPESRGGRRDRVRRKPGPDQGERPTRE